MFPYSVAVPFYWGVFDVGTGKIVLHSITCNGSPTRLVNCSYSLVQGSSSAGCSLHYDAGIRCYGVLHIIMHICIISCLCSFGIVCCGSFQFHPPALLVPSLSWMGGVRWRGGWRFAEVGCGEQFMTTVVGISMMHKSHANNWDTFPIVS